MSTTTPLSHSIDDYLELIRRFPLRPIRSRREHEQAGRILNGLIGRQEPLTVGERDYMEALAELSKVFEDHAGTMVVRTMGPLDALRYLMNESGMNTEALGKLLGSQPAASLILSGKRQLSKTHIFKLADYFKVDPGLFLQRPAKETVE